MANILHQLEAAEDDANLAYLRSEVERLRLTDAEREAIYRASQYLSQNDVFEGMAEDAAVLRALLERTK